MAKKRKRGGGAARSAKRARRAAAPKGNVVWRQSAEEATLAGKPRYNGFACGHGAHGSAKYSRAAAKRDWRKQLGQEGASRGSFLFVSLRAFDGRRGVVRHESASVWCLRRENAGFYG